MLVAPPVPLLMLLQVPMVASLDVHTDADGQPLPLVPRQPSTQVRLVASQTLALVVLPQSESIRQLTHCPMVASLDVQR
jgi:hypothetical protein